MLCVQPLPFTKADGSVIEVVDQDYFHWEESDELERGQEITGLSYDVAFLKKMAHKGAVQAVSKDRGTGFAVSVEQIFVDSQSQEGASGTGFFNADRKLVLAPLSYRWDFIRPGPPPVDVPWDSNYISASGTSSRVSKPLTDYMLNPANAPNGANNHYLIPSLGIIPVQVVSAVNIYVDWADTYLPYAQTRGIIFYFLATQAYYEYLIDLAGCVGMDLYVANPPSMLGAPLDEILSGTPPDPFPDLLGGFPVMIVLEANCAP